MGCQFLGKGIENILNFVAKIKYLLQ